MLKDLKVSHRREPIGLDETPRFSWKIDSSANDVWQKGYRIQVSAKGKIVWDSGLQEKDTQLYVPYEGEPLLPFTRYLVQVTAWDSYGQMHQARTSFETGVLGRENWIGTWITHEFPKEERRCPVFVRTVPVPGRVKAARLYATAAGVYEARINGERAGDALLAPGWTSYHHRLQYQTIDITDLLREGDNELAITLGCGWYRGYLGFDDRPDRYGDRTALLAMVRIELEGGQVLTLGTDTDWLVREGEILSSELYYGEVRDLTAEKRALGHAVPFAEKDRLGELVAQESEPVRVTRRFPVAKRIVTPKGELVFDFSQNMAGIVEVTLPPLTGEKLVISHAETLDRDGNFYMENLRTAVSNDTYIYGPSDVGRAVMPSFIFHGFRYIRVEGAGMDVDPAAFTACAIHSDMERTSSLTVSNPLVQRLLMNVEWGQRSNFVDLPTDCPQRNERLGWTGDAQVFCRAAAIQFDTALFFAKWLRDVAAETNSEHGVPHVVPNILGDRDGAAAWSDAAVIIPWNQYMAYGDLDLLREQYPMMRTWVEYIRSKASPNGLWQSGFQYGDWLALDIEAGSGDRTGGTDRYLVASAFYAHSAGILQDAAHALGYEEDEREYGALREEIVRAIGEEYVTATGRLVSETQTACVLMLHFDLVRGEAKERVLQTLISNLARHRNHLTTGFVGTPYLCHCLSENGRHDLSAEVFLKEDFPGWLYAVKKGATTVWERWDSVKPDGSFDASGMNSLNHYAYGAIADWLYGKVAGIAPVLPGYRRFVVRPRLTPGLEEVDARVETVYGTIECHTVCRDGRITVDLVIPPGTRADVALPEREGERELGSGHYHYEYETKTSLRRARFTTESTLGELVAEEAGRRCFEELSPGMLDTPMIQYAYGMTVAELIAMAPEGEPLYLAVIDALNASWGSRRDGTHGKIDWQNCLPESQDNLTNK